MAELLFKLLIGITVFLAVVAALTLIPEFAALLTVTTESTGELTNVIEQFTAVLEQYVQPFIGLLNNILPESVKSALMLLIVWKIIKVYALWFIRWTAGMAQKLITMANG